MDSPIMQTQTPIVPPSISPVEKHTRRGITIVIIVVILAGAGWFAYQKYILPKVAQPIPFSQLSPEEQEKQKAIAAQQMATYNATLTQPTEKQKESAAVQMKKYNATVTQPTEVEKAVAAAEMAAYAQKK